MTSDGRGFSRDSQRLSVVGALRVLQLPRSAHPLVGFPRMAPQPCRRLVDPDDVRANGLAVPTSRDDEIAVVGLRTLQVIDHEICSLRLDRSLEANQYRKK